MIPHRAALTLVLGAALPFAAQSRPATKPAPAASKEHPNGPRPARVRPVELNVATRDELMKLPGVDRLMADAIIAGRPYRTKTNLVTRKIVPQQLYASLRYLVSARQPAR